MPLSTAAVSTMCLMENTYQPKGEERGKTVHKATMLFY